MNLWKQYKTVWILVICITVGFVDLVVGQDQNDNPPLMKYKLKKGTVFNYGFSGDATVDGKEHEFDGRLKLSVDAINVDKNLSGLPLAPPKDGLSTSTAFAVTADGYMLTCAHCVLGAEKLTVTTPKGRLAARVVDVDKDLDLAIIKVDAEELPTVSLANAAIVELAQNVRAIGFPLSNVLGNSVKISQGAVSGFLNNRSGKVYQIDVAVNPGNSGGPLVDNQGNVIGVVNAKLEGEAISKIGFSIPITYACEMLDRNKIKHDFDLKSQPLTGPELAKLVTPAVCFVNAELGPDGYQSYTNFQISVSGTINRGDVDKSFFGRAIIRKNGYVVDTQSDQNVPYIFNSVCELPFEYLPPIATKKWEENQTITFQVPSRSRFRHEDLFLGLDMERFHARFFDTFPDRDPLGPNSPFNSPFFSRRQGVIPGERHVSYQVIKHEEEKVVIQRTENLRTVVSSSNSPKIDFANRKELIFDTDKGIFTNYKLDGTLKQLVGGQEKTIPVSFRFDLQSELENRPTVAHSRNPDSNQNSSDKPLKVVKKRESIAPDQLLKDFLADKSLGSNDQLRLLVRLANARYQIVDSQRQKLVTAVSSLASSRQGNIRKAAIDALLSLDQITAIPMMVDELTKADRFSKRSWINKLVQTDHPIAAQELCDLLAKDYSDSLLKQGLKNMGGIAEVAVLKQLELNRTNMVAANALLEILVVVQTNLTRTEIRSWIKNKKWKPDKDSQILVDKILLTDAPLRLENNGEDDPFGS